MNRTRQETFDYVFNQLVAQGGPSYRGSKCLYNGPDGRHCAIGWLFADAGVTAPEGYGVASVAAGQLVPWLLADLVFYLDLQRAHDDTNRDVPWEPEITDSFRTLAADYGLTFKEDRS